VAAALPRLIVITDWSLPREALLERLDQALSAGPEVAVQHRHPGAPIRAFLEEARALRGLCARRGNALFVNGRPDVALLVDAHLHLPAGGVRPSEARPLLPEGRWISAAVHDEAEARDAEGADLALVSPVFAPGSKPEDTRAPLGPEGFGALARRLSCPAYALGGIDAERARRVNGAAGAACITPVLHAADPRQAAEALLLALGRSG
jgi:thiamine-phosphate pyrophosphorylase